MVPPTKGSRRLGNSTRGFSDTNTGQNMENIFDNARAEEDDIDDYQDMDEEEFENRMRSFQSRQTQKVLVSPSRANL